MIRRIGLLALFAVVGCGGSDSTGTGAVLTTLSVAVSANVLQVGQTATATATGADQNGANIATGTVTWSSSSPNATVTADGKITAVTPGAAVITGSAGGKTSQAALTIVPLPAVALQITAFPPGSYQNRVQIIPAPVVQLVSAAGTPVSQAGVTVTASASVGTMVGTSTVSTDANGRATFSLMAFAGRTLGTRNLVFSAAGMTPTSASVNVLVGPPTIGSIVAGNNQSARAGTAVAVAPSILVMDPDSIPTPNIPMEFFVSIGGGTVTGSPATTNAAGIATLGSWVLGAVAGSNALQARPVGFSGGVVFSATGTAASALITPLPSLVSESVSRPFFRFSSPYRILD